MAHTPFGLFLKTIASSEILVARFFMATTEYSVRCISLDRRTYIVCPVRVFNPFELHIIKMKQNEVEETKETERERKSVVTVAVCVA